MDQFPTHLALILAIIFSPGLLASLRRHRNAGAIWLLNLMIAATAFLFWPLALLGWMIALVWAAKASDRA